MTHDPIESLLAAGPAELADPSLWTKRDSDILAHFLQVQAQIHGSHWYASEINFTMQGGKTLEASMPAFEAFVFAAVYFRQLIMKKDSLLQDAADRYCAHVSSPIRKQMIEHEVASFYRVVDSPTAPFQVSNYTLRELFDAFMYGASLMHKIPEEGKMHRERFLEIYDNHPRAKVLYALNMGLRVLTNYIGSVAVIIYQDYSHWQDKHSLPLPDVRWHDRIFDVDTET